MMMKALITAAGLLVLAGCATAPVAPVATLPADQLWRDQEFGYTEAPIPVGTPELFALAADLLSALQTSGVKGASTQKRVDHLIDLLFGPDLKPFPYASDLSFTAAETWRSKRGNCLSLSVLAYSVAKALDLPVQLQEVRVAQFFDRHGSVDFVGRHVNVLIRNDARLHLRTGVIAAGDVVIDFEPRSGWLRAGTALSEEGVLARYYNNIAADHFAQGNLTRAYAWFKAAIVADPQYSSSYGNLAQLYRRKGFTDSAERLLLHAIALSEVDDTPVHSLHQLLVAQGRDAEAAKYAAILKARQEKNPYYWLGVGLDYLREAKYSRAVSALERAEALTSGFDEVHRYLAIAYWRNGDQARANKQLEVLASLLPVGTARTNDAGYAALSRKLRNPPDN